MSLISPDHSEFPRPLKIDRLGAEPERHEIEATAAERAALARRFGLVDVKRLSATVALGLVDGGTTIRLDGRLTAEVVQSCVVSLAEISSTIDESFVLFYVPASSVPEAARSGSEVLDESGLDEPEALLGDTIDVGEVVAQQLAVLVDPYPRAAGVDLADIWQENSAAENHPFAALAQLKARGH